VNIARSLRLGPRVGADRVQQCLRLQAGQERRLRLGLLLDRDRVDSGGGVQMLGGLGGVEGHDGLDRGQPQVPGGSAVAPRGFQVIEEGEH
jgi:hypothetical protein